MVINFKSSVIMLISWQYFVLKDKWYMCRMWCNFKGLKSLWFLSGSGMGAVFNQHIWTLIQVWTSIPQSYFILSPLRVGFFDTFFLIGPQWSINITDIQCICLCTAYMWILPKKRGFFLLSNSKCHLLWECMVYPRNCFLLWKMR